MTSANLTPRAKGTQAPPKRFYWAQLTVSAAFLVLAGRLWQLQVLSGDLYFKKSADNFVKELDLPAPRGQIRDRKGRTLAENRPAYNVYVTPRIFTDDSLQRLARILRLDDDQVDSLREKLARPRGVDRTRPMVAFEDIWRDELGRIESDRSELPGVTVQAEAARNYPNAALASHVIGYLNQITADELADRREHGYHAGDAIGRSGLERQWEPYLRGQDGRERIIVDAKGQRKLDADDLVDLLGGPQRTEPVPGHDIITTLDLDLQRAVERALKKHKSAAAAVVEVNTGRVLALASVPAPDPNLLSGRLSRAQADALVSDKVGRPLIDKTLRENYFPGSTYKIVPMLAALEDKAIDPEEIVTCHGAIKFGGRWFHCVESHAKVNLHRALVESCNVFFYGVGDKLGLDRMARVATELGLGAPTGLGLNGEVPGFVPDMEHYRKAGGFQKGVVLNSAIGQGSVKVTVLQLTMAYAAIASGKLWVPQIVSRIETPSGRVVQEFQPKLRRELVAQVSDLKRIRAALLGAVSDPKGTSYASRIAGFDVAGKTGTAQVTNRRVKDSPEGAAESDHAWFASFAPAHDPQIAVVVLVEHGGFGAKSATPAAMEIYREYFGLPRAAGEGMPRGAAGL